MSADPVYVARERPAYRYYDLIMVAFVTVLLCSNLIGPGKSCRIEIAGSSLVFGAGNIFFPISYIFDDVLTEVYGFARSRRVIWAGFVAMVFAVTMSMVVIHLPVDAGEPFQRQVAARHRARVRQWLSDRARLPSGVLGGRLRQFLRPREK